MALTHVRFHKGRVLKATAEEKRLIEAALAQQDNMQADIRQAFLDAIDRVGSNIDVQQVTQYIQQGRIDQAIATVNDALSQRGFASVAAAVSQAALTAGIAATNTGPDLGEMNISFGVTNPATITALRNYEFDLIRGLTADSRASVAAAIRDGVENGSNPADIARGLRDYIGLTPRQTQAVLNYEDALRSGSSSALDRALRDRRFDPTVQRAVNGEKDLSDEQISNMVDRYRSRYLNYRANTIARTESMRAQSTGNQEAWKQAVDGGTVPADQVVRYWWHSHDDKVRDAHLAIPEMNPDGVGLDEPFDSPLGPIMFPGDPEADPANTINCRCVVIIRNEPDKSTALNPEEEAAQTPVGTGILGGLLNALNPFESGQ